MPVDTEARLCAIYEAWEREQGLSLGSADEMLCAGKDNAGRTFTAEQRAWLQGFSDRWEEWARLDDERRPTYQRVQRDLDEEAKRRGLSPLDAEQVEALRDPAQAFAMLDDLEARCGMAVSDARVELSKIHEAIDVDDVVLAGLKAAAQKLVDRYKVAIGDDDEWPDGEAVHAALAEGALEAAYDPNTGGGVWLSHSIHAAHGRRLHLSAGSDSVIVYLVPEFFDEADEQAPSGENTAQRMAAHVWTLCGDDAHMTVTKWYYGEE